MNPQNPPPPASSMLLIQTLATKPLCNSLFVERKIVNETSCVIAAKNWLHYAMDKADNRFSSTFHHVAVSVGTCRPLAYGGPLHVDSNGNMVPVNVFAKRPITNQDINKYFGFSTTMELCIRV